jgi:hypothetical protein
MARMIASLIHLSGTLNDIERDTNTVGSSRDNNPILWLVSSKGIYKSSRSKNDKIWAMEHYHGPRTGAILEGHKATESRVAYKHVTPRQSYVLAFSMFEAMQPFTFSLPVIRTENILYS